MTDLYISKDNSSKKGKMFKVLIVLIVLVTLAALTLAVIAISSFLKANQVMEEEGSELSPFASNILPEYSRVSFQTLDGQLNLRGWWLYSQAEETIATVILVHGQGMNRLPFGLDSVELFDNLTEAGCAVLTFDLRNSAESDGELSSFGYMESEDVLAALAYVNTQTRSDQPIILYGIGSGTSAIMRSMTELSEIYALENNSNVNGQTELPHPDRISALILDTPARSSEDFIAASMAQEESIGRYFFPRTVPLAIRLSSGNKEKQDYLHYLSQLTLPVLLLGHERDSLLAERAYLPLWTERERIHPSLTETFKVKGSGHLTAYTSESSDYAMSIVDFINDWF